MRAFLSAIAFLTLLAVSANAGPKEEALAVVESWGKLFIASDVDGVVKLYAPDATFLGTSSKATVVKTEGIRSYFENALLNTKWQSAPLKDVAVTALSDTNVVITALDELAGVRNGQSVGGKGRVTFVVAKRGDDWKIVHFHRSAMPN
jgi:uncharacterized protein (TIGR02246 family)